jgi:hypothetical protein
MTRIISASLSPKQLSKLRNGHKVRIKQGTGFNIIVNPDTYHIVNRSFTKNKGIDIKLSPEEIEMNKMYSPEAHSEMASKMSEVGLDPPMVGNGIFSKMKRGFKKGFKKVGKVLNPVAQTAKKVGKVLKPVAQTAWKYSKPVLKPVGHALIKEGLKALPKALESGLTAAAMATGQPELVPVAKIVGNVGGKEAAKHLGKYNDRYLGKGFHNIGRKVVKAQQGRGVVHNRRHSFDDSEMMLGLSNNEKGFLKKYNQIPYESYYNEVGGPPSRGSGARGSGLYAGRAGRGLFAGGGIDNNDIGHRSTRVLPPALMSQPYSANFHFQFQLPPQYQQYEQWPGIDF